MKLPKNRKVNSDSYQIAVARSLFIKWMKKKGKWNIYKSSIRSAIGYEDAWMRPSDPEDFLGATSILYDEYLEWCDIVRDNRLYFYDTLYNIQRQLPISVC